MKHDNESLWLQDVSETQHYPPNPPITMSCVFQVVSTLSELLKLNFRNKILKLSILATLGEFLHLISSQVVFTI